MEHTSSKIMCEMCPLCESELKGVRKKFNGGGKALQKLEFDCPECKGLIYAKKAGRYFTIGAV